MLHPDRISHTGAILLADEKGAYKALRCFDLVRDFSQGSPEPDSFADTFRDVECGAIVRAVDGRTTKTECDWGHQHTSYQDLQWEALEREYAYYEQQRDEHFDPMTDLSHVC